MADSSKSKPQDDKTTPKTNPPEAKKTASNPEPTPAKSPESGTANKMTPPPKPEPQPEPVAAKPAKSPEPQPQVTTPKPPEPKIEPTTQPTAALPESTTGTADPSEVDVAAIKDRVVAFISNLPQNASQFFGEYSRPLTTVILIVALLVTLRVLVGVIDIINEIPLVQPTLELVGITFSGWFIYRYLLRSENRRELAAKFEALKAEVLGEKS